MGPRGQAWYKDEQDGERRTHHARQPAPCAMIVHVNDRRELQGCKLDARQTRLDETRPVCRPTLIAGQGFTAGKWREYKYSRGIALARECLPRPGAV